MQENEQRWRRSVLVLLSSLLSACGGGGTSGNDDTGGDSGDGVYSPDNINGSLTGYLFIDDDNAYLDLRRGELVSLEVDNIYHTVMPSMDGQELVTTIEDYRYLPGLGPDVDAVVIKSMRDGRVSDVFEVSNSIYGSASLSPNRQLVAAIWRDESSYEDYGDERLTVFSRAGVVVGRSPHRDVSSFDWVGDGRLVYAVGDTIYITTQPNDISDTQLLYRFGSDIGKPLHLAVSPDSTRLVFELYTGGSPSPFVDWRDASVWMMNLDGSDLHLLATTDDEDPRVNSTAWSPDGEWVATVEGYIGGITEVYDPFEPGEWRWEVLEGIPGVLYAVPSSGENVLLPGDGSTGVVPVVRASGANQVRPVLPGFSPKLRWIADIPIPAEDRGSLPENAGAWNGGLRGSIYFDDDGLGDTTALHVVDLQNATDQELFNLTDDDLDNVSDLVYVSRDGQYVSHQYDDTFDGAIFIKDHLGRHLMGISTETDSYDMAVTEAVRFSPVDADLILVSYVDFYDNNVSYLDETVSVIDWTVPSYTKHYFDREYVSADWTPSGDILLAGADGNIYLATVDGREFSDPVLHISTRDSITNMAVSPDGTRIAYTMNRHIWVSDFDGGSFRRLTGFAEHFNMLPEWSPDSNYIAFKQIDNDDGPNDLGRLWVVAADSADVQVRGIADTPNAVALQTGEKQLRLFGCFSWR